MMQQEQVLHAEFITFARLRCCVSLRNIIGSAHGCVQAVMREPDMAAQRLVLALLS